MLLMGDELGRTQKGNNNAYCQDNEISWMSWSDVDSGLLDFTRWVIALRKQHPIFRRRRFFQGRPIRGSVDIAWLKPDGKQMTDQDWTSRHARALGVFLNGDAIPGHDERGQPIVDDSFVLLFNGHARAVYWSLPPELDGPWHLVLTTDHMQAEAEPSPVAGRIVTRARSVVLLRRPRSG